MTAPFSTIEEAIEAIRAGQIVVVVDAEDRENEGDFICAAEKATADAVNFMITQGRGQLCMPILPEVSQRLSLHPMVEAPGHRRLVTHVFPRGDAYLDSDSVFGVRDSLVVDVHRQMPNAPTPDGRELAGPWSRIEFDIVLAPA